jgi:tRNA pseudouridine38-40 synthase
MRIKLTVAYNGALFEGSQVQPHTRATVTGTMYKALRELGIESKLHPSGRTDRGVHATGQVMHCDLPEHWKDLTKLINRLNAHLPDSVLIRRIEPAADDFHARYSARSRVYRYVIDEGAPNPFEAQFITFIAKTLDLDTINEAMQCFVGTHDFSRFKKSGGGATTFTRTVTRAFAYRHHGRVILNFEANGFLRAQIRMMTGALLALNEGKLDLTQLKQLIALSHRHRFKLAPENGLYLAKIKY